MSYLNAGLFVPSSSVAFKQTASTQRMFYLVPGDLNFEALLYNCIPFLHTNAFIYLRKRTKRL